MRQLDFAYARARVQARHGGLPGARLWRQLEASQTAAHYLAQARTGPLAPWLTGLAEDAEAHRIEEQLRARWLGHVAEVAGWLPARWQAATRWFGTLPGLPLADEPLRSESAAGWLQAWQQLVPDPPARAALLPQVAALLMPQLPGARGGPVGVGAGRAALAEPQRQALEQLYRRHAASPVSVFAHLALVALDVERLRGGIVTRLLLGPPPPPGSAAAAPSRGA